MSKKTKRDIILIISILSVAALMFLITRTESENGAYVEISVKGKSYKTAPLNVDAEIDVEGALTVVIKDGKAFIKNASCKNKICQNHKPISKSGETIACLPCGITVRVTGNSGADFVI